MCLYNVLTEEQYIFRVVMRQKEKEFEFLGARSCIYEETNERIHNLIIKVYESFPCPIVHVPVLPPEERVDFILKTFKK